MLARCVFLALIAPMLLGGCASRVGLRIGAADIFAYDAPGDANPFDAARPQVDLNVALRTELARQDLDPGAAYGGAKEFTRLTVLAAGAEAPAQVRDVVVADALAASEQSCARYLSSLRGAQVAHRLAADLISVSAGVAGGLSAGATAQNWSAVSGLATASSASIDRNVFADQAIELVRVAITDERAKSRAAIEARLGEDYATYPLGAALADVAAHHASCSLLYGLGAAQRALETREAAVAAMREAARQVAAQGGGGPEVAAAVAGVADAMSN